MSIPPRFLNELRDRLTLSDIIGRRVKLARAGREFKGCCPFHKEKTPSFYVNDDKQFYHCFGCGAHGDAIGFVMQHDNLSFIEAVEALAGQAGMQVPQQSPQEVAKARKQKDLHALMEDTARYYEAQLQAPANREALDYMVSRGVSRELLAAFRIGYAPADSEALRSHLKGQGYSDKQMIEAGVMRPSKRGGNPYAFFRERVMFPVTDRRGRVVAFGGRILPDHLRPPDRGDYKPPKYMNSSDTPLFHKGRMLYGESQARQAAADDQPLIVVEGYLDVMACFSAGYRGAVAPLGTALTEEQILALWQMIPGGEKLPVMCFDGDEAGRRAAARAAERLLPLLKPDHSALFAFLPEGQDPDSLIRSQGKASFAAVIAAAMPLSEFLWSYHTAGRAFETPEARAGLAAQLMAEADRIADRQAQQYYRQAFRDRLYKAFGPSTFQKGGQKGDQKGGEGRRQGRGTMPGLGSGGRVLRRPGFAGSLIHAQILLATVLNHPFIFDQVEEELAQCAIGHERLDLLRQSILNTLSAAPALDAQALQGHLKEQGFESEIRAILSESVYTHAGFARPDTPEDQILQGWRDTVSFMNRQAVRGELKAAGSALAQDFSRDNEERVLALHDVHKASGD